GRPDRPRPCRLRVRGAPPLAPRARERAPRRDGAGPAHTLDGGVHLHRALGAGPGARGSLILAHTGHHETIASAWETPVAVLAGAAFALVLFGQAFVRLRRRGRKDHAGWDRAALFALAVALGTLALVSPLDYIGEEYLLSAHMLQHVIIGDLAVVLAVVALRGPLTFFLIPSAVLGRLARLAWLRSGLRVLLNPKVAFVLWAVVIAGWHVPAA